jgi:hypothetical protein
VTDLFIRTPEDGYWFTKQMISAVEQSRNAKYMGYWSKKTIAGDWSEQPVDVFYQQEAHPRGSNYFGLYRVEGKVYIVDAASCFSEPIIGVICEDREVLVSRYRHDYVTRGDRMIDGGRDYVRGSPHPTAKVSVENDQFVFDVTESEQPDLGNIIARNDLLDEIMVEHGDTMARYKRVVD